MLGHFIWFIKNYTGLFVKSSALLVELGRLFTGLAGFEGGLAGPLSYSSSPDGTIVLRQASIMHKERGERVCDMLSSIIHQSAGDVCARLFLFPNITPSCSFREGEMKGVEVSDGGLFIKMSHISPLAYSSSCNPVWECDVLLCVTRHPMQVYDLELRWMGCTNVEFLDR